VFDVATATTGEPIFGIRGESPRLIISAEDM